MRETIIIELKELQLSVIEYQDRIVIVKPLDVIGNTIPNYQYTAISSLNEQLEVINEVVSDCPKMACCFGTEQITLSVWDWVPGPGPGDFELDFEDMKQVIPFIRSYFFENNLYFEQRKNHHLNENQNR